LLHNSIAALQKQLIDIHESLEMGNNARTKIPLRRLFLQKKHQLDDIIKKLFDL
jgi:hypothetical protein